MKPAGYRRPAPNDSETYLTLNPPFGRLSGGGALMMNLKQELDALIESTMAFVSDAKRPQPIPDLPVAVRAAEEALADTSKPVPSPTTITPTVWPGSEREEIRQR